MSKISIHVGGCDANELLARMKTPASVQSSYCDEVVSIATHDAREIREGENILYVVGDPLPEPKRAPKNWRDAVNELRLYEGVFNLVYLDTSEKKLVICTDLLGFQPLYCYKYMGNLKFSSDSKSFTGDPDLASWGSFLSLGYTLGSATLTKDVERLPGATVIVIDMIALHCEMETYWRFPECSQDYSLQEISEAFDESVQNSVSIVQSKQILMMSGGFDSRLIAVSLKKFNQDFKGCVVSHYDEHNDLDGRLAMKVANQYNFDCQIFIPDRDFFSSKNYLNYVFASDAEFPSLNLFISHVLQYIQKSTIWEGAVPGNTLNSFHQNQGGFAQILDKDAFREDALVWDAARRVFGEGIADDMRNECIASLRKEIEKYEDNEFGVVQFLINNKSRNRTSNNPFKVFQRESQVISPGMTRRFLNSTLSVHPNKKLKGQFFKEFLRFYEPNALSNPIVSGGSIIKTTDYSYKYYIEMYRSILSKYIKKNKFIANRPRLVTMFGLRDYIQSPNSSDFLLSKDLFVENDAYICDKFLNSVRGGEKISLECRKILLYWRFWRWLREGVLLDRLGERAE